MIFFQCFLLKYGTFGVNSRLSRFQSLLATQTALSAVSLSLLLLFSLSSSLLLFLHSSLTLAKNDPLLLCLTQARPTHRFNERRESLSLSLSQVLLPSLFSSLSFITHYDEPSRDRYGDENHRCCRHSKRNVEAKWAAIINLIKTQNVLVREPLFIVRRDCPRGAIINRLPGLKLY